jgi:recombination protein RecA
MSADKSTISPKNESADREQKLRIIEDAISSIEKTYGKGSIMKLGDGVVAQVEAISTGALSLDFALGIGGIPRGRVTEIY